VNSINTVTGPENQTTKFPSFTVSARAPREGDEPQDGPVTFDDRQQARISELIREAQGKAAKELRAQLKANTDEMERIRLELEEAKKASKTGTPSERKEASEDVAALTAQLAEIKAAADALRRDFEAKDNQVKALENTIKSKDKELLTARKQWEMQRAAEQVGFVDMETVLTMTDKQIKWDADRQTFVVIGESGSERRNAAMELMTLSEFYQDFATKKPFLARGNTQGGTGSTENRGSGSKRLPLEKLFGKGSDAKLANELAKTDPAEYRRRRAEAKAAGLV